MMSGGFAIPKIEVPQHKLEKLADDLKKLEINAVIKVGKDAAPVPAFQRQGYLEKLGHSRSKWFRRFFVLRDSFLLSYNLQKSDFTVEPRAAIHLGGSTTQLVDQQGKPHCFLITTQQKDRFLFAAASEEERQAWLNDIAEARNVTHANMIKLAVENQCLAEEKGASNVARDNSVSALALFSNAEYIHNTPITGGAEGWLRTSGFNAEEGKKKTLTKCYFILRDSHLLMFHGGDILTKPRGAMYLLGTQVVVDDESSQEKEYHFNVKSFECGDEIGLVASSRKVRTRWVQALTVASRVTYPDYRLLLKEHEILGMLTLTPRAAPPSKPNEPAPKMEAPPAPLLGEDVDLQGEQLDPATQQAYDANGNPLLRNPDGKLVDVDGNELDAKKPRFADSGAQLDPFNRPLPPGAVPMFDKDGTPIGVGPDGQHYLPDGTLLAAGTAHFDADGKQLGDEQVQAADAVATNINVAMKVRAKLRGEGVKEDPVDVLGRSFRANNESGKKGVLINADGVEVPLNSARKRQEDGKLVDYKEEDAKQPTGKQEMRILVDDEGEEKELGTVEIDDIMTFMDVRQRIQQEIEVNFPDFVFLYNGVPMLKYEERDRLALTGLPETFIRGKELKPVEAPPKFSKKISEIAQYQDQKKREQDEFSDIMKRVREGKFLRNTKAME